jgi:predicted nucleic acid-binding protein
VNASPLILLTKAGRLDLLRLGVAEVIVPDAVIAEVGAKGPHDPTALAVAGAAWIAIKTAPPMPDPVRACGLDAGESAVLALALGDTDCEVVLDDRAGRLCAARAGIACLGTLGLVLLARRLGSIPEARPVIERLRQVGLYLDDEFVGDVLKRIGE